MITEQNKDQLAVRLWDQLMKCSDYATIYDLWLEPGNKLRYKLNYQSGDQLGVQLNIQLRNKIREVKLTLCHFGKTTKEK